VILIPNGQFHPPGPLFLFTQTPGGTVTNFTQHFFQQVVVVTVFRKHPRLLHHGNRTHRIHRRPVYSARMLVERKTKPPECQSQMFHLHCSNITNNAEVQIRKLHLRLRPDAGKQPHRQRRQKRRFVPMGNIMQPVRLNHLGSDPADHFVGSDAERCIEVNLLADLFLGLPCRIPWRTEKPSGSRNVQICMTVARRLKQRRKTCQDPKECVGSTEIQRLVRRQNDRLPAVANSPRKRHPTANARIPGFGGQRRHNGTGRTPVRHHYRPSAQFRMNHPLHGHWKILYRHINDFAFHL